MARFAMLSDAKRGWPRLARGGFIVLDALGAVLLLGTLVLMLGVAVGQHRSALHELNDRRALIRSAERVVAELQAPAGELALPDGQTYAIEELAEASAPAGGRWVRVTVASEHGRAESLVAVVRSEALEGESGEGGEA